MTAAFSEQRALPFMPVEYVQPEFSRSKIEAAGKALAGTLTNVEEAVGVFAIAHNWRNAHVFPMRRVRYELGGLTRRANATGAITAARIKRMKSIRKKLRETPLTLYQIQDIGGCRAIVGTVDQLRAIVRLYEQGQSRHGIIKPWDYIDSPKPDGYRSYHLALKFTGQGDEGVYNRQRIEVQIRTRLQHVWATAVEAVGVVRGEDLKGGKGNGDWLRLFALMSSEIAILELATTVPGIPESESERREELRHLNNKLAAADNLRCWNSAIRITDQISTSLSKFYVVQYDPDTQRVTVEPALRISQGYENLIQEEQGHERRDTVFVEVDRAEDLKDAYPNYFLDVGVFNNLLVGAVDGRSADELRQIISPVMPKAEPVPKPAYRGILRFGRWARLS
jgi:Region found in RelA / SpoT proteins